MFKGRSREEGYGDHFLPLRVKTRENAEIANFCLRSPKHEEVLLSQNMIKRF